MAVDTGTLLLEMQRKGSMTDCSFVIEGIEMKAHANVICCRGGKLRDMVAENPNGIEINEVTRQTFSTILK